jgi:POT family proton-dependent oligopeptide transporter
VFRPKGLKAILGLGVLYIFIACFWALYDQTGSSWVLQADKMDRAFDLRFGPFQWAWLQFELLPSQIQALNPVLIMLYIPLFNFVVYPLAAKYVKVTPLRKIGAGFFITGVSFAIIAYAEQMIAAGMTPSIFWQFLAYVIITAGEVLISITALEYSYTQAPNTMKSVIMGIFLLSVSIGNFITAGVNAMIQNPDGSVALAGPAYYWFFTGLVCAAGVLYIVAAIFYKEESYIQEFVPAKPSEA